MIGQASGYQQAQLAPLPPTTYARTLVYFSTQTITGINTINVNLGPFKRASIYTFITAVSGTNPQMQLTVYLNDAHFNNFFIVAYSPVWVASAEGVMVLGPDVPATTGQPSPTSTPSASTGIYTYTTMLSDEIRLQWIVNGTTPSFTFETVIYGDNL